jgi:hypothetical protein
MPLYPAESNEGNNVVASTTSMPNLKPTQESKNPTKTTPVSNLKPPAPAKKTKTQRKAHKWAQMKTKLGSKICVMVGAKNSSIEQRGALSEEHGIDIDSEESEDNDDELDDSDN